MQYRLRGMARVCVCALTLSSACLNDARADGASSNWWAFWQRSVDEAPADRSEVSRSDEDAALPAECDRPRDGRLARCLRQWAADRRQPQYGLVPCPPGAQVHAPRLLVIFLHGMNSRPEDMATLVDDARAAGYRSATFRYPNDQRISQSARQLAAELKQLQRQHKRLTVALVAHSMGGLVAREAIENPALGVTNVRRLIMISPPNHGSELARYARSLDVWEYATSAARRDEAGWLTGAVCDGLAEAVDDLRPGSAFLNRLNSRPRNPHVDYTIFAGSAGPLEEDRCGTAQRWLQSVGRRCGWEAAATGRICLLPAEELRQGKGDGCVAVRRARLDGVKDFVVAEFSHREILDDTDDPAVRKVRKAILKRLAATGDDAQVNGKLTLSPTGLGCDPRHCYDSISPRHTG